MDRWQSYPVEFKGGLITNASPLQQGLNAPGSAIVLRNFEPSVEGGYRRIEGFSKWDDDVVPGTNEIRGLIEFEQSVVAARNDALYVSGGSGWTEITDNATYSSAGINIAGTGKVRFAQHHFGTENVLIIVDGTDKPYKYDGETFEQITTATVDQEGASHVIAFKNHMFFAKGTVLSFSAPFDDSDFTAASGAGTIGFDDNITDLILFRQNLVVFTEGSIHLVAGNSIADFQVQPVTRDIGAVQEDTAQEIGGDVMFLGPDGLRLLSATERNNDFGLSVVTKAIQPTMLDFIQQSNLYSSVVIRSKSQYRLLGYNPSINNISARGIIGTQYAEQGGEGMAWGETRGIKAYVASSTLNDNEEFIIFGNDSGYVYRMEDGNDFDGTKIRATFQTPHLPVTDPTTRKTFYKMKLFVDPQGSFSSLLSTEFNYNDKGTVQPAPINIGNTATPVAFYGSASFGTATYGGNLKYIFDLQLMGSGFVASFKFESDSDDPPYSFDSMIIQYAQYGRR
jgi:hypothetical protein